MPIKLIHVWFLLCCTFTYIFPIGFLPIPSLKSQGGKRRLNGDPDWRRTGWRFRGTNRWGTRERSGKWDLGQTDEKPGEKIKNFHAWTWKIVRNSATVAPCGDRSCVYWHKFTQAQHFLPQQNNKWSRDNINFSYSKEKKLTNCPTYPVKSSKYSNWLAATVRCFFRRRSWKTKLKTEGGFTMIVRVLVRLKSSVNLDQISLGAQSIWRWTPATSRQPTSGEPHLQSSRSGASFPIGRVFSTIERNLLIAACWTIFK